MRALVRGTGVDYDYELVRILPTWLTKAAFLLWDSLPADIQGDYTIVKDKLLEAFGQAHPPAPRESLDVYSADISKFVQEAFPGYGEMAHKDSSQVPGGI